MAHSATQPSADPARHPAPHRSAVALAALWFGLFGAPGVWSIQLMVSYAFAAHSCYPARIPLHAPTFGWVWTLELVVSLVALVVALAAGATALHSWRATRTESEGPKEALLEAGEGRTRFMAFAGILTSALFLLGVVLNGAALFLLPVCG